MATKYTAIADVKDVNLNIELGRYYGTSYRSSFDARLDIRKQLQVALKTESLEFIDIKIIEFREEEATQWLWHVHGDFGWAVVSARTSGKALEKVTDSLGLCELPIAIGETADQILLIHKK